MMQMQESVILIAIGLILGVVHATICEPKQNSSSDNFLQTVDSIMDSVTRKTNKSQFLSFIQCLYVLCFWGGSISFILNHIQKSKEIIVAYLAQ